MPLLRGGEVLVDGHFDEVGSEHIAGRLQDNCDRRDGNLKFIGGEIANQPPHQSPVIRFAYNVVIRGLARVVRRDRLSGRVGFVLLIGHWLYFRRI